MVYARFVENRVIGPTAIGVNIVVRYTQALIMLLRWRMVAGTFGLMSNLLT